MSASIRPGPRRISTPVSGTPARPAPSDAGNAPARPPASVRPRQPAPPSKPARPAPLPFPVRPASPPDRRRTTPSSPPREPIPLPTRSYVSPWAPQPAAAPTLAPGGIERRKLGGRVTRALSSPLPALSPERARRIGRWTLRVGLALAAIVMLAGIGLGARGLWEMRRPVLLARHRPEALCFRLAESPAFAPPMTIEPSVSLLRGRFGPSTPAGYAIREAMGLTDPLVIGEKKRTVGDFEVTTLWARIPGQDGFWLVLGWMEGSDLASLSFHFPSEDGALSREIVNWGDRLMVRLLIPANFRTGAPPSASWRQAGKATLPTFGPPMVRSRA